MADHKQGEMDISVQEATFDGFMKFVTRGVITILVLVAFRDALQVPLFILLFLKSLDSLRGGILSFRVLFGLDLVVVGDHVIRVVFA